MKRPCAFMNWRSGWPPRDFVRASKSAIVNFGRVSSICPDLGGRLRLTLENGEVVGVSRQYAPAIRKKLGL